MSKKSEFVVDVRIEERKSYLFWVKIAGKITGVTRRVLFELLYTIYGVMDGRYMFGSRRASSFSFESLEYFINKKKARLV